MKKKWVTNKEKMAKQMIEHLNRRQFLSYGIKTGATLSIPGFLSTILGETTAFAAVDLGVAKVPVVQIHTPGGPLEYLVPLLADGITPVPPNLIGNYGVANDMLSRTGGTVEAMGVTWFNRSRTGINDFIVSLTNQAGGSLSDCYAYNIASNSDDDDANGEHNCNNVLSAAGFKGGITDAIDITGGLRATQALKVAFNPFNAPSFSQIQELVAYAPAFASVKGADSLLSSTRFSGSAESILTQFSGSLKSLSELQSNKLFKSLPEADQIRVRESLSRSFKDNPNAIIETRFGDNKLDVSADADYIAAFTNVAPGVSLTNNTIRTYATGLEALVKGVANFIGFTYRGGMDYHQNVASGADDNNVGVGNGTLEKDRDVGALIGATINLFKRKGKDVIIVLTKDGACRGTNDHTARVVATGDNGERASQLVIFVNGSTTKLPIQQVRRQVGARRSDNGQVDTSYLVSKSDVNCASAIGAAILYFNGVPVSDIRKIYPLFETDADVLNAIGLKLT